MRCLHEREVGVDKYRVVCGCSVSERGETLFVLVPRIIILSKIRTTELLDYVDFNINHLNKGRVVWYKRGYVGILI